MIIVKITEWEGQENEEKQWKNLFSSSDYTVGIYTYFMVSRIPSTEVMRVLPPQVITILDILFYLNNTLEDATVGTRFV
jgi:hypothetical protein